MHGSPRPPALQLKWKRGGGCVCICVYVWQAGDCGAGVTVGLRGTSRSCEGGAGGCSRWLYVRKKKKEWWWWWMGLTLKRSQIPKRCVCVFVCAHICVKQANRAKVTIWLNLKKIHTCCNFTALFRWRVVIAVYNCSELTHSCMKVEIRQITDRDTGQQGWTCCQDGCCGAAARCQQATCRHLLLLQPDIMLIHGASNCCYSRGLTGPGRESAVLLWWKQPYDTLLSWY